MYFYSNSNSNSLVSTSGIFYTEHISCWLHQPYLEWDMAGKFLLQTMQLWTFCKAIPQYGDGYCYGKGMANSHFIILLLFSAQFGWWTQCLHVVTSGFWYGLDSSSRYRWINTPSWCPGVFFKAVASWCSRKCWYGHIS